MCVYMFIYIYIYNCSCCGVGCRSPGRGLQDVAPKHRVLRRRMGEFRAQASGGGQATSASRPGARLRMVVVSSSAVSAVSAVSHFAVFTLCRFPVLPFCRFVVLPLRSLCHVSRVPLCRFSQKHRFSDSALRFAGRVDRDKRLHNRNRHLRNHFGLAMAFPNGCSVILPNISSCVSGTFLHMS